MLSIVLNTNKNKKKIDIRDPNNVIIIQINKYKK